MSRQECYDKTPPCVLAARAQHGAKFLQPFTINGGVPYKGNVSIILVGWVLLNVLLEYFAFLALNYVTDYS